MNKMLSRNMGKRLTISEIKRHKWYIGDIMMGNDLSDEMKKLKKDN
jgi:hypothetical protein